MTYVEILIALAVGYAVFAVFLGLATLRSPDSVQLRLNHYGTRVRSLAEIEFERTFADRAIKPLLRRLANLAMRLVPRIDLDVIRLKLDRAGNPASISPADFVGAQFLAAFLYAAVPFGVLYVRGGTPIPTLVLYCVVASVMGYYLPVLWLRSRIRARQKEIQNRLPDALDLITVSVEAGLTFEGAMAKAAEYADNELSRAFGRVLLELQLGVARAEALRNMGDRAGVPDLNNFVTALIQAEQLGVSLAKVLRVQSDEMRIKRRQRAEEQAHRAPVKMSVVLVLLLLPAIFMIILGPSVPRVCHQLSPSNRLCGG